MLTFLLANSSEIDLCCIIGNLFDNAIEASLQLSRKTTDPHLYGHEKRISYTFLSTNLQPGKEVEKTGKSFKSTKGDSHGLGLIRIDDIVKRSDGYISREQ